MKTNTAAVRIVILTLCGLLVAALLTLLGLILFGGGFSSASEPPYDGPVLTDVGGMRGVLVTDADLTLTDGGSEASDAESSADGSSVSAAALTKSLENIGATAVVYDGSSDGLSALLAAKTEASPEVYALYRVLSAETVVDADTDDTLYAEIRSFVTNHPGLAGVVFTDYRLSDTDSLRAYYAEKGGQTGFASFCAEQEKFLLARAQQAVRVADKTAKIGAVATVTQLSSALDSSIYTDFVLLDASASDGTYSAEAADVWVQYTDTSAETYALYTSPVSFDTLAASQQSLAAFQICDGYLVTGLPSEAEPEPTATPTPTATETPTAQPTETPTPTASPEPTVASSSAPDSTEESLPEGGDIEPVASSEPAEVLQNTDDVSLAAHENTLRLLAGLTDPADMTPFYMPEELLSDKLILNRPLSKSGSGTASALLFTGIVPLGSTVTLDDEPVALDEYGHFHHDVPLFVGANIIYLRVDEDTYTFTYTRNTINVSLYSPINSAVVDGGTEVPVWVTARNGASVTATLGDTTVALEQQNTYAFSTFTGSILLPEGTAGETTSLGNVIFRIDYDGATQTVTGGAISLNPTDLVLPARVAVQAEDTKYKDDGNAITYPVTPYGAQAPELLDFDSAADSNWKFFPIPNGATDAVTGRAVYGGVEYYILQSGVRVAASDLVETDVPYAENTISALTVLNDGEYTNVVLNMTAAVFYQVEYTGDSVRFTFADTVSVPDDLTLTKTPVFTSASWEGSTLVLSLRTTDGFLGYTASYEGTKLILHCTNPPSSGSVVGARITVDPGHGGLGTDQEDVGAIGAGMLDEAQLNYYIGSYLCDYLTELGASPVLTPSLSEPLTVVQRMDYAAAHQSSMVISIHHNAATTGASYGVGTFYYQDYSEPLAALVQKDVSAAHDAWIKTADGNDNGLYHTRYLFTLRTGWVSLMLEDGFTCNGATYTQLVKPEFQASVAKALATAIATYYERYSAVADWPTGIESTLSSASASASSASDAGDGSATASSSVSSQASSAVLG